MATLNESTKALFKRVYNNEMILSDTEKNILGDEAEIKAICQEVFGDGSVEPSPDALHSFNQLVTELGDEIAKPKVTNLLSLLANEKNAKRGTLVKIDLPKKIKTKVIWSANGSTVDFKRVEGRDSIVAEWKTFTSGYQYDPLDLVTNTVETFNKLVNDVADAKVRLYMKELATMVDAGVSSADIPANNVISGSNTSISDYNKLASRAARYGGRPVLIADSVMIDDLASKQVADTNLSKIISDRYSDELLLALNVTQVGRTNAFNLVNPFSDKDNTLTELSVQKGYMVAGENGEKPFTIISYGGLRQETTKNFEDGRVFVKIAQDVSINLVYTSNFFYIKDTALTV